MSQKVYTDLDFQNRSITNLTLDANGTGNSITNLEVADFAQDVIDTDNTLTADSDTRIPTQKAIKAYVDTNVAPAYTDDFLIADWIGASAPYSLVYAETTHNQGIEKCYFISIVDSNGDKVLIDENTNSTTGDVTIFSNVKFDGSIRIRK